MNNLYLQYFAHFKVIFTLLNRGPVYLKLNQKMYKYSRNELKMR